jgi:hypothetical protein
MEKPSAEGAAFIRSRAIGDTSPNTTVRVADASGAETAADPRLRAQRDGLTGERLSQFVSYVPGEGSARRLKSRPSKHASSTRSTRMHSSKAW